MLARFVGRSEFSCGLVLSRGALYHLLVYWFLFSWTQCSSLFITISNFMCCLRVLCGDFFVFLFAALCILKFLIFVITSWLKEAISRILRHSCPLTLSINSYPKKIIYRSQLGRFCLSVLRTAPEDPFLTSLQNRAVHFGSYFTLRLLRFSMLLFVLLSFMSNGMVFWILFLLVFTTFHFYTCSFIGLYSNHVS